ncbi:uncharacterized protein LOC128546650 [Mercenaria mercenaria]|uniref:uncharacterized protein LOC128546650 n=1 Tax=Mercenaria mercenaria TaxID=6596 RepID=UPI00234EA9F0|nr:uncharacterized protein LOC128546650 [Mercenaria mercenaria]
MSKAAPSITPRRCAVTPKRKSLFNNNQEEQGSQKLITAMIGGATSPFSHARRKGIKIYTESEIRRAKGFDKYRLPFLNEISERLAKDGLKKTEIVGAADFEWRLRKCELLSNSATDASSPSLLRNLDRMESAYKKVKASALVVQNARNTQKHILADTVEKEELCPYMTELRKSQDAVVKAMQRVEAKSKKQESSSSSESDGECGVTADEMEEAVRVVKRKRDIYDFDE